MEAFVSWFQSKHGVLDTSAMGFAEFPGCGRGAVALNDLPEDHTLFTIPRDVTLSTRTSALPALIGSVEWKRFGLDEGWAGLILCMLWEEAQGPLSKWAGYFAILPTQFDTPMFWSDDELQELRGTSVVDKIGRDDAERDFYGKVMPTVQSRPELFPTDSIPLHYTLENYHRMGSCILSRSFHVSRWTGEGNEEAPRDDDAPVASGSMDVDSNERSAPSSGPGTPEPIEAAGYSEDSDDEDDPSDVAMVPVADMLNARFETENAKLFDEEHALKMITTKPIRAGEQIWNTYGDLPNADLLRRYGHVDLVPLKPPLEGEGNPADIVEVRGDLIVSVASVSPEDARDRVDWWLENEEDDGFVIGTDCELPSDFISFTRLLLESPAEWAKTRTKSKTPKAKADAQVLAVAIKVLEKRISEYPTTLEDDVALLASPGLPVRKRYAVVLRLGEKSILRATIAELRKCQEAAQASSNDNKRKVGHHRSDTNTSTGAQKKARR